MTEQPHLTEWNSTCLGDRMGELQLLVDEHGPILAWRDPTSGEIEHFKLGTFDGRHVVIAVKIAEPRDKAHPANRPPAPTEGQKNLRVELCRQELASPSADSSAAVES